MALATDMRDSLAADGNNVEHVFNVLVVLSLEYDEIVPHKNFTDRLHSHDIGFSTSECSRRS